MNVNQLVTLALDNLTITLTLVTLVAIVVLERDAVRSGLSGRTGGVIGVGTGFLGAVFGGIRRIGAGLLGGLGRRLGLGGGGSRSVGLVRRVGRFLWTLVTAPLRGLVEVARMLRVPSVSIPRPSFGGGRGGGWLGRLGSGLTTPLRWLRRGLERLWSAVTWLPRFLVALVGLRGVLAALWRPVQGAVGRAGAGVRGGLRSARGRLAALPLWPVVEIAGVVIGGAIFGWFVAPILPV